MRSIGIRELRQRASEYLRQVRRGETFEVTDRGKPVALLVPVPAHAGIERLKAEGRIVTSQGDLLEIGEPLPSTPGVPLPSEALLKARADER